MKTNIELFKGLKPRHKFFIIIGGVILISIATKSVHAVIKRRTASRSFGNENISVAKRLYMALYPEGKPNSKFKIWNPISMVNVAGDLFKEGADVQQLMRIAGNELNADNFKKVSNAYNKLYKSNLLIDLQDRMLEDYTTFDDKVRQQSAISDDPDKKARIIRTLALNMYKNMNTNWFQGGFTINDKLFNQLDQMSDTDFELVNKEFLKVLKENGEDGTMRTWIDDDARTMDAYNSISDRLNYLGLE